MRNLKVTLMICALALGSVIANAQYDYNYTPQPQRRPPPKQNPSSSSNSKDDGFNPTGFITVTIGAAIPFGSFAANYGSNAGYGSYALTGGAECLSAGIPLCNTNIGIALMYANFDNPFDMNGFLNTQLSQNGNVYQNGYYGVYQEDYVESNILAGVFYTWPVKRFSFDFRAMAGVMICNLPEITYASPSYATTATNDFQWDYAASRTVAFSYDVGASIRCKLRRTLCLSANIDYCSGRPHYSTGETYVDDQGNEYLSPVSGSIPMSFLNISLGIGYQFK
jgi:hypothetical protein